MDGGVVRERGGRVWVLADDRGRVAWEAGG